MPVLRSDYIPLGQRDNDWSTNKEEEESEALYVHHYSVEEDGGCSYNIQSAEKKSTGSDPIPSYHQYQVSCAMLGSGHNTYTEWNSFLSADRYAFSRSLLKRPGFNEPSFESGAGHIMPDSMSPVSALQRQSSASSLTESLVLSDVPLSSLINPSASYNALLYEDVGWKRYDWALPQQEFEEEGPLLCQSWAQQTEQSYNMQLTLALRLMADAERMEEPYTSVESFKDICPPPTSQNSVEATAYRFWVTSRLGYGDRIQNGFYQIWGINPHIWSICNNEKDGLLPSLDSLYSVDPTKAAIEVILVDKHVDDCLAGLMSEALNIAQQTSDSKELAEHLGKIVCEVMGGAASLEDGELKARWTNSSKMLKARFGHIVFPIGSLSVGLCRHRALLFKVLADTTNLPCRIAKGCKYCSVDCSASCLVVCETDREFLVDLIANPGALCSLELVVTRFPAVGITSPLKFPPLNTLESSSDSTSYMDYSPESSPGVLHPYFDKQESILIGDSISKMGTSQYSFEKYEANPLLPETPAASKTSMVRSMVEHSLLTSLDEIQRVAAIGSGSKGKESSSTVDAVKLTNSCGGLKKTAFNSQSTSGTTVLGRRAGKLVVAEESKERTISLNPLLHSSNHNDRAPLVTNARVDNERARSNQASFALKAKDSNDVGGRRLEVCENVGGLGAESNNLKLSLALNGLEIPWEEVEFQEQIEDSDNVGRRSLEVGEDVGGARAASDNLELSLALDGLEIPWEELKLRERIGAGSFGTVYRADWHGSDVAVKIFMEQDAIDERRNEFVREIAIIKRMRHPNVVLFMGAVTKRPSLSIVTEYLPRGSLFRILHRLGGRETLDEKRRIRMALDVAKGMNYLHRLNPPIVHRDLKSPNLLVDKTWTVKVCDFGLSRFKANTFLSSRSAGGTPEWMAPEVLRDEPSNEKSDVYSFGVILWELITLQQPWSGLSPIQVVAAVGFQNRRLQIPKDLNLEMASLIESCWSSDARQRPPFSDIMEILKGFTKSPSLTLSGRNRSA